MRISHKHKFVFIAIGKTGSSTIREALNQFSDIRGVGDNKSPYYEHTPANKLKTHFEEKNWNWDEYFKFAFVRNPWDLAVSHYFYRKKLTETLPKPNWPDWLWVSHSELSKFPTPASWVISRQARLMYYRDHEMEDQSEMLEDGAGNQLIDFVGRLENLQQDFNIVCDKIEIPRQELPHRNKTKHKHYTEYYDDKAREIVSERYKRDIETFGYEFGK